MTLKDSKVVIVGGSSGIGLGVAEALLAEGAWVTIVGRTVEKLRSAQDSLTPTDRVKVIAADVTQEDQVRALFEESGMIDHLVVTRGTPPVGAPIASLDLDEVRRFVDLMLVSAISVAKHAAPKFVGADRSPLPPALRRTNRRFQEVPSSRQSPGRWDIWHGPSHLSLLQRGLTSSPPAG